MIFNKLIYLPVIILLLQSCTSTNSETTPETVFENQFIAAKKEASDYIRKTIQLSDSTKGISIHGIRLKNPKEIESFYTTHHFSPGWLKHSDSMGLINEIARYIENIYYHGLNPSDYLADTILHYSQLVQANKNLLLQPDFIARFDLLLSDAFFSLSQHLYYGKVSPKSLSAGWEIDQAKPALNFTSELALFLKGAQSLNSFMQRFYPSHPGYNKMVIYAQLLSETQKEDSFLVIIPEDKITLHILEDSSYNEQLVNRLRYLGYTHQTLLDYTDSLQNLFTAIKNLQEHYGLNQDGVVGKRTYSALNETTEEKLGKLFVNMERLRWMPASFSEHYLLVNIADYTLDYIKNQDTLLHMRTVVGKDARQTPVFQARMTYLVFSPTWTLPPSILYEDVIPAVAKNIDYLQKKEMIVLNRSGNSVDPNTIDWKKAGKGNFPYRIRQKPGGLNALGRVKFMFPNTHSIYLHDTPSKSFFQRDSRTFSSGCIRIEKPIALAELLLENNSAEWTEEEIKEAMFSEEEQIVTLKEKPDVYIYYLTAWSTTTGEIHFREDVYSRDPEILKALQLTKKK